MVCLTNQDVSSKQFTSSDLSFVKRFPSPSQPILLVSGTCITLEKRRNRIDIFLNDQSQSNNKADKIFSATFPLDSINTKFVVSIKPSVPKLPPKTKLAQLSLPMTINEKRMLEQFQSHLKTWGEGKSVSVNPNYPLCKIASFVSQSLSLPSDTSVLILSEGRIVRASETAVGVARKNRSSLTKLHILVMDKSVKEILEREMMKEGEEEGGWKLFDVSEECRIKRRLFRRDNTQ